MAKRETFDWAGTAGSILKTLGLWFLKLCAGLLWIVLSVISLLIKHIVDSLKKWLFPKEF